MASPVRIGSRALLRISPILRRLIARVAGKITISHSCHDRLPQVKSFREISRSRVIICFVASQPRTSLSWRGRPPMPPLSPQSSSKHRGLRESTLTNQDAGRPDITSSWQLTDHHLKFPFPLVIAGRRPKTACHNYRSKTHGLMMPGISRACPDAQSRTPNCPTAKRLYR